MSSSAARLLLGALDRCLGSEGSAESLVVLRIDPISVRFGERNASLCWTNREWYMESSDFQSYGGGNGDGMWRIHWYAVAGLSSASIAKCLTDKYNIRITENGSGGYTWNGGGETIITIKDMYVEKTGQKAESFPAGIFNTQYDKAPHATQVKPGVKVVEVTRMNAATLFAAHGVA